MDFVQNLSEYLPWANPWFGCSSYKTDHAKLLGGSKWHPWTDGQPRHPLNMVQSEDQDLGCGNQAPRIRTSVDESVVSILTSSVRVGCLDTSACTKRDILPSCTFMIKSTRAGWRHNILYPLYQGVFIQRCWHHAREARLKANLAFAALCWWHGWTYR